MNLFAHIFKKDAPAVDDGYETMAAIKTLCQTCRWMRLDGVTCEAFPEGVPTVILAGIWDHHYTYGDEDLTYEPSLATKIKTSKSEAFEELHPRYPKGSPKAGKFMPKGSPEYNAAIAKAKSAKVKSFSAQKFYNNNNPSKVDITDKSALMKAGNALAEKHLSPEQYAEFVQKQQELAQSIKNGEETFRKHAVAVSSNGTVTYTPERLKKHDEIINSFFKNADKFKPKDGTPPSFVMLGGRGGAGKSHFKDTLDKYNESHSLVVDNDKIKEMLPEYDPQKAYLCHKEAGDILDQVLAKARDRGLNVVLDSTMRELDSTLDDFKKDGYHVAVDFMHVPPETAVVRALHRWLNLDKGQDTVKDGKVVRGRLVPPDVILKMTTNESNFDKVKDQVHDWSFYRNDSPVRGVGPALVANKEQGYVNEPFKGNAQ